MIHRLCSKMSSRPRTTSGVPFLALTFACGLLCVAPGSRAAESAPPWLKAAAQEKLPEYPSDTVAVILLDERQTTVKDSGEITTLHRGAFRLLRPEARKDYSDIFVDFDSETKISYLKAWTIAPNGREIAADPRNVVERSVYDDIEFTDVRVEGVKFPEADTGSVVGYEYLQRGRPFIFEDNWIFQEDVPVRHARFALQLPAGWEFSSHWINHPEEKSQDSGPNQHAWALTDIPAIEVEPEMPPRSAIAGWVGFKYFPNDPALRAKTNSSWKDLGVWFNGITQASRASTPAIKQKVAELTAGKTNPLQQMRALTEYMQKQVRYFAIEIGIGGYQPHPAADVFAHQYGDCKDKATLLSTMLREIGIESYYVIIDTNRGIVHPDYPSVRFNHVILAIRLPDAVEDPTLYATRDQPGLGRLLFFDPTNEYVPLGYLPSYLQDNYGLLVTPEGGNLVSLPLLPPLSNRLIRSATLKLTPAGDLSGEIQETSWGGPAAEDRRQLIQREPGNRAEVFESLLGASLNNFTLTGASVGNLTKYDEVLSLDYKFAALGYAQSAGNLLIFRPGVLDHNGSDAGYLLFGAKPRKYPIEFREAGRQDDVYDIVLPDGYVVDELPPPMKVDSEYASYQSQVEVRGSTLHYTRTYVIKQITIPTPKLDELKDFISRISGDRNTTAVLRLAAAQ
jgi:transglutaminase-like putative cysteine protease